MVYNNNFILTVYAKVLYAVIAIPLRRKGISCTPYLPFMYAVLMSLNRRIYGTRTAYESSRKGVRDTQNCTFSFFSLYTETHVFGKVSL